MPLFIRGVKVSDETVRAKIARHVLPSEQALIMAGAGMLHLTLQL